MKKRKISRTAAILAVNTAPKRIIESSPRETLKSFQYQHDAAEAEKAEAPLRAAKDENSKLLQQLIEQDKLTLYSGESSFLAATAPSIGTGEQFDGLAPESIKATIRKAFSTVEDSLEGTLTASGKQKMQNVARANLNIDTTQPAAWQQIFTLLRESGELLDQGDSGSPDFVVKEVEEPQEQKESSLADIENMELGSRSGRAAAMPILMQRMQEQAREYFLAFYASIEQNFHYSLSESEVESVIDIMKARNYNFVNVKDWDRARLAAIAQGRLSKALRYKSEILDELIEEGDTRSYAGRQELRRQERLLGVPITQVEY